GSERGLMFVDHMSRGGKDIANGVYTFIVYEISKNDHEKNIRWWKSRLKESGLDPQMDQEKAEVAFTYLKDAGADHSQISSFIKIYNSISQRSAAPAAYDCWDANPLRGSSPVCFALCVSMV